MIQIITHSSYLPKETIYWQQLLDEGADCILLRKPGWTIAEYEQLLLEADATCYNQLIIAEHVELCETYGLQGVHFSETSSSLLPVDKLVEYRQRDWRLSTSVHTTAALQTASAYWDQLLLAPIFDSISKPAHYSAFSEDFQLSKGNYTGNVLALGGVDHTTARKARNMQFDGIALLGAIWQEPAAAVSRFRQIKDIWHNIGPS
ncbi:thiamine phosphate synthase [Chitinophaga rhizophila]|uniref:Thiamine phosphate synthase n=1 Tax=Chitinophaga rhizophila TaxID=2866212 RepID=A0ABS7GE88_9BACT|nr:thiamine phosphate synthase [Chitinophaga rhizophila]MBW8685972.1 thiamine phosphate synthase [Chitinophaga rhizophila]